MDPLGPGAPVTAACHGDCLGYLEALYARYREDPAAVSAAWRARFEGLAAADAAAAVPSPGPAPAFGGVAEKSGRAADATLQARADRLAQAFRLRGHRAAALDPLRGPPPLPAELDAAAHGLSPADLERRVAPGTVHGAGAITLRAALERLRRTYCGAIGAQFMHIDDPEARLFLQRRMEESENRPRLRPEEQRRILALLTDAAVFEELCGRRFLGAKRFSLEGAESLLPLLASAVEKAGSGGVEEIVLAMSHRGRLNILANLMGKSVRAIFRDFEGAAGGGSGDVRYHLGYSRDWRTAAGARVHLSLMFNPSHVEFADPVALGRMRAKQDRAGDRERRRGLVILVHGDAALAGEGIVQETLNLSELDAYSVGGALHVVIDNRLGFTTEPRQYASSACCTDIARLLQSPIFHVNGEDPEAVAQALDLALEFRRRWRRDAVVDMFCYRRHGHNEMDEPAFTQPELYRRVRARGTVRAAYLERLLRLGGVTRARADELAGERRRRLERQLDAPGAAPEPHPAPGAWEGYFGGPERGADEPPTGAPEARLRELLDAMTRPPEGFSVHPKIAKGLERRRAMSRGERPVDWAAGEALAFCALAAEGRRVRLTGQDSERGTFSQRHAVLHDSRDGRGWEALDAASGGRRLVEIRNSPLSELGVLGFEYGYSLDAPDALTVWEAQYGDFANAAQVIFDQFLASAEDKWRRLSGLVLLLPHGYEGEGPEHSSARLERLLSLAALDNIQVAQPTTAAQHFHLLRRQVLRRWRKPLIVLTPKSLLRHPGTASPLSALAAGRFRRVLGDAQGDPRAARRLLLCSGKVYFDLAARREERRVEGAALIRVEQLYPYPAGELKEALRPYAEGTEAVWVQEEPENMGAWRYLRLRAGDRLLERFPLRRVSRPESASTATGSKAVHARERERLLEEAFAGL